MPRYKTSLFTVLFVFAFTLAGVGDCTKDFSAETVSVVGERKLHGSFYGTPQSWRVDFEADGQRRITIFRKDKKLIWQIDAVKNQYEEYSLNDEDVEMLSSGKVAGEIQRVALEKELVDGRRATKYKVDFGDKVKGYLYQWIDDELSTPIQVVNSHGRLITKLQHIRTGPQPGSLFEIPAGYMKVPGKNPK